MNSVGDIRQKILNSIILPIDEKSIRYRCSSKGKRNIYHVLLRDRNGDFMNVCNTRLKNDDEADPDKIRFDLLCRTCTFGRYKAITDISIEYNAKLLVEFYNSIRTHKSVRNYCNAKRNEYEDTGDLERYLQNSMVDQAFYKLRPHSTGEPALPADYPKIDRFRDNLLAGFRYCNHVQLRLVISLSDVVTLVCPGCGDRIINLDCTCIKPVLIKVYDEYEIEYCNTCQNFINHHKLSEFK